MRASPHERRLKALVDNMGDEDIAIMYRLLGHRVLVLLRQAFEPPRAEERDVSATAAAAAS